MATNTLLPQCDSFSITSLILPLIGLFGTCLEVVFTLIPLSPLV
jgi:hypothetical protein